MFGKSVKLFTLLGFEVKVDFSWIIIAVLVTWSLAKGLFPFYYEDLSNTTYWYMGIAGAVGLFLSIVVHEFSHSVVARRFGIPMRGITLFIFGGVAEMNEEPQSAKSELYMAVAGPGASVVVGGVFYLIHLVTQGNIVSVAFHGVLQYLGFINLVLAGFNLLPAFPLDGGRVLRSILWGWKDNIRWATRISSQIGSGFGVFLIIMGAFNFISGNFIGGVWWFLIGMFVRTASQNSYQQLILRKELEGEKVERFMKENPITVSSNVTIRELVEDYVYKYHFKMFPVVEDSKLIGCVTTRQIKQYPPEEWEKYTVRELAKECTEENTIGKDEDAVKALSIMRNSGNSRLMVVDDKGKLVGILVLKDLLDFFFLRIDLEGE